jgi:hypothetical protein
MEIPSGGGFSTEPQQPQQSGEYIAVKINNHFGNPLIYGQIIQDIVIKKYQNHILSLNFLVLLKVNYKLN